MHAYNFGAQNLKFGMAFALNGEGALWDAVTNGDLAEVQKLLKKGADPNMTCPDNFVRTAMAPKTKGTGRSLLHHAAWVGNLAVFRAIVEAGGDIERRRNTAWRPHGGVGGRGNTPLHAAVMYRRVPIVEYLLDLGVDVNTAGEQGYTALHISTKFNYPELVALLLEAGARTGVSLVSFSVSVCVGVCVCVCVCGYSSVSVLNCDT
jgi:ankyrin repeat protein